MLLKRRFFFHLLDVFDTIASREAILDAMVEFK